MGKSARHGNAEALPSRCVSPQDDLYRPVQSRRVRHQPDRHQTGGDLLLPTRLTLNRGLSGSPPWRDRPSVSFTKAR